ncbi:hypothetical protein D3C85_954300 [compost metagenome]
MLPDLAELSRGFAKDVGAGDVGVVAVDQGARVDQHHIVDLQRPVALAAVRQAGVVAERDETEPGAALPAQFAVLGVDEALDLRGQDARLQPVARAALDFEGDGLGAGQQRDLGCGLDAALRHDQRAAVDHPVRAQSLAHTQPDEGRRLIVHRQLAVRRHTGRRQSIGAFFLFPGQDIARDRVRSRGQAADLVQFEPGADVFQPPIGVDQGAGQALGRIPVQTGEIAQRGRRAEQQGRQPFRPQPGSHGPNAGAPLIGGDGRG